MTEASAEKLRVAKQLAELAAKRIAAHNGVKDALAEFFEQSAARWAAKANADDDCPF
jgi:hypothetical protein